jgi:hypothetical protein
LNFIENKGQWDSKVKYVGQVNAGAFYIHEDGFTVVQHDVEKWGKLHHNSHSMKEKKHSAAPIDTLKSHSYRVQFLIHQSLRR